MLVVEDLSVNFGKASVLRDISLRVGPAEFVSLIGPNGAGKSTLLKALAGLVPVSRGRIVFDGGEVQALPPDQRNRLGICLVPEGRQVFGSFSVADNLLLGTFSHHRKTPKAEIDRDMERMFELFPILKKRLDQRAGTLSGGEQQMLAIARALMSRPKLLLMDEPSLGLAPLVVREIFRVTQDLHGPGLPILLVEQNALAALKIAERAYVLDHGRVVFHGVEKELLGMEALRRAYLGA